MFRYALAALVVLVAAEAISRRLTSSGSISTGFPTDRRLAPYTMFGAGRHEKDLNALGYRGPVATLPKPPGELRIAMIGASVVVLGDPPLPELLQAELWKRGHDQARVYNYGVIAGSSGMDLARLVYEVSDRDPDLVVLYDGGNDITTPFLFDPRPGYPLNFLVYESNPLLQSDLRTYPAGMLLLYGSNLARWLLSDQFRRAFVPIERLRRESGYGTDAWKERIIEVYLDNVRRAAAFSRGIDAAFIALVQPLVYFKDTPSSEERVFVEAMERKLAREGMSGFTEYTRDMRRRLAAGLVRAAAEGTTVADLTSLFATSAQQDFTDFIHTTQDSMQVVAGEIARRILADPACRARFDGHSHDAP